MFLFFFCNNTNIWQPSPKNPKAWKHIRSSAPAHLSGCLRFCLDPCCTDSAFWLKMHLCSQTYSLKEPKSLGVAFQTAQPPSAPAVKEPRQLVLLHLAREFFPQVSPADVCSVAAPPGSSQHFEILCFFHYSLVKCSTSYLSSLGLLHYRFPTLRALQEF